MTTAGDEASRRERDDAPAGLAPGAQAEAGGGSADATLATPPGGAPMSVGAILREMVRIGGPAVVTMTSYSAMQFADTLIVKTLGPDAVAAVGNGGVSAFVPAAFLFGFLSVVNTFVSQNLGAGKPERGAAYAWNAMWLVIVAWVLVLAPFAIFLPEVFATMRGVLGLEPPSPEVLQMETTYGRIVLLGMGFTAGARGIAHYFYGMHRPLVVMVSAVSANLINLGLTLVFVLGLFGVAPMGVAGAAIATVIASALEMLLPFALFLSPKYNRAFGTRAEWKPSPAHARDIVNLGWAPAMMFANEVFCWWIFMAGFIPTFDGDGPAVNGTAGWIALRYMHLSFMPAVGFSIALSAIVGKAVGAGNYPAAVRRTWIGLWITVAYMSAWAIAFVIFREPLVAIFIDEGTDPAVREQIIAVGTKVLIIAAAFQLFDAVAIALSGALRGAGDTVWPGIVTMVSAWTFIVGGGWAAVRFAPEWGSLGPWIGAAAFIIALALLLFGRFLGGGWKTKRVAGERAGPRAGADARPGPGEPGHVHEPGTVASPASCPHCAADLIAAGIESGDPEAACPECGGALRV